MGGIVIKKVMGRGLGVEPGARVLLEWNGTVLEATFIKTDKGYDVFKLENGYNIGLKPDEYKIREVLGKKHVGKPVYKFLPEFEKNLPAVGLAATGGTIAARVDYLTGAVKAEFTVEDFVNTFPEMREIAKPVLRQLTNIFSEDMIPSLWKEIAKGVYDLLRETKGVVITHGTDTMHYTAAYLSFALRTPKPVVLTGAQRSSDRPSSDAAINLISSLYVAGYSNLSGVFINMHCSSDDGWNCVHLGTRVRKFHTSRRDTFRSVGRPPVAKVYVELRGGRIVKKRLEVLDTNLLNKETVLSLDDSLNENIGLLKFYPGMKRNVFEGFLLEHDGVIIEGTGFGHIRNDIIDVIEQATESGVFVGITSQTIFGRTHPHVYSTAVRMVEAGAVFLEDMLPETAFAKLVWAAGKTRDIHKIKELMLRNIAGEITRRSVVEWIL